MVSMRRAGDLDPMSQSWHGLSWSGWYPLVDVVARGYKEKIQGFDTDTVDQENALYRFAVRHWEPDLMYVGETARSPRQRLMEHWSCFQGGPNSRAFHGAIGRISEEPGGDWTLRVSWSALDNADEGERKGLECELIAAHRRARNRNPRFQFLGEVTGIQKGAVSEEEILDRLLRLLGTL